MTLTTDENLDEVDLDALTRAMAKAREDRDRAKQLDAMLKERPWREVAEFAAYCCQCDMLDLQIYENPSCHAHIVGQPTDPAAARLLERLLVAGLSQWEPDPLAALVEAAEQDAAT
jgi:hypothetical protein